MIKNLINIIKLTYALRKMNFQTHEHHYLLQIRCLCFHQHQIRIQSHRTNHQNQNGNRDVFLVLRGVLFYALFDVVLCVP